MMRSSTPKEVPSPKAAASQVNASNSNNAVFDRVNLPAAVVASPTTVLAVEMPRSPRFAVAISTNAGPCASPEPPAIDAHHHHSLTTNEIHRTSLWDLTVVALPAFFTQIVRSLFISFVLRISNRQLTTTETAGVVLGMTIANVFLTSIGMGIASVLDSLCAQEVGRVQSTACPKIGLFCRRTLLLFLPYAILMQFLFVLIGSFLLHLTFKADAAEATYRYLLFSSMSGAALPLTSAVQKALASMGMTAPPLIGQCVGLTSCVPWVYMWLHILPDTMKVEAVSIAFGCSRLTTLITCCLVSWRSRTVRMSWGSWSTKEVLEKKEMWIFMKLSLPSIAASCAERWTPEILSLLAGTFAVEEVAAWGICASIWNLMWAVGAGFYTAVGLHVGQNVGRGNVEEAQRIAWLSLLVVSVIMCPLTATFAGFGNWYAALFGAPEAVQSAVTDVAPFIAIVIFCDTNMYVFQAIFRSLRLVRFYSVIVLTSQWCVGIPLAAILGFASPLKFVGVAVGLVAAMVLECILSLRKLHAWTKQTISNSTATSSAPSVVFESDVQFEPPVPGGVPVPPEGTTITPTV